MLPFDNKSEFQVVVEMPAGTPLENTAATLHELGAYLAQQPEVLNLQAYAGTASPITFNGLVRQYTCTHGFDDLAIHPHPAAFDVLLCLATRTVGLGCEALGQAIAYFLLGDVGLFRTIGAVFCDCFGLRHWRTNTAAR
jgi:hypothetical protein